MAEPRCILYMRELLHVLGTSSSCSNEAWRSLLEGCESSPVVGCALSVRRLCMESSWLRLESFCCCAAARCANAEKSWVMLRYDNMVSWYRDTMMPRYYDTTIPRCYDPLRRDVSYIHTEYILAHLHTSIRPSITHTSIRPPTPCIYT